MSIKSKDISLEKVSDKIEDEWEKISDNVEKSWDRVCDYIEANFGDFGKWISTKILRRITVEAPVVICFSLLCVIIHILNITIAPGLNRFLAVQDTFSFFSPLQYPRLFTHVLAHDRHISHLKGNLMNLLLVGPSAEHVYGSQAMLLIFLLVAIVSAFAHILVGDAYTHQLGASGIVFSVILLNSLVAADSGEIPISFILTAGLWCTDEIVRFVWKTDDSSHHAHLTGAIVGTIAGYYFKGRHRLQEINESRSRSQSNNTTKSLNVPSYWKTLTKAKAS